MTCLIKANSLSKNYGAKRALDNVSFEVEEGAAVALVGPNGAGKTTLFSILCGYLPASSGDVSILGRAPSSPQNFGQLAALPQDALLDPQFTIGHQLSFYSGLQGFSGKNKIIEVERVLELVGLPDAIKEKPTDLSHGMRKRAAIAQALIGTPKIILLDEATAGLDPKHARDIRSIISSLSGDITFLLSSHDLSELERLCTKVLYIESGRLKEHSVTNEESVDHYLTLRMEHSYPALESELQKITGIIEVSRSIEKEYLIKSSNSEHEQVDVNVLKLCHANGWRYRQLINGKTLENQLF